MLMPADLPAAYTGLGQWLKQVKKPLLITHARPDGDAIGSTIALALILQAMGAESRFYFDRKLFPPQLEPFIPAGLECTEPVRLNDYDALICLDCGTADRLGTPADLCPGPFEMPCANIDHHVSNPAYGDINLIDDSAAATAEVLTKLSVAFDLPLPRGAATALLVGITQDTGCFRFTNTSPNVMRHAAWLMEQGGDYQKVMDELYFNIPVQLMRLQARVIDETKLAYNNRLAYFCVSDELLESCGASVAEADDLIDVVRTIKGVVITCRMQKVDNDVRFSFRSQDPKLPILGIAQALHGGGHAMAAGATLHDSSLEEAEKKLLELAGDLLNG